MSATVSTTQGERPQCQTPFLIGDPGYFTSWATHKDGCDRPATWVVRADTERIIGRSPYSGRMPMRYRVKVYGCGRHPLRTGGPNPTWQPTPGIVAQPLEGYPLPREMRALRDGKSRRAA